MNRDYTHHLQHLSILAHEGTSNAWRNYPLKWYTRALNLDWAMAKNILTAHEHKATTTTTSTAHTQLISCHRVQQWISFDWALHFDNTPKRVGQIEPQRPTNPRNCHSARHWQCHRCDGQMFSTHKSRPMYRPSTWPPPCCTCAVCRPTIPIDKTANTISFCRYRIVNIMGMIHENFDIGPIDQLLPMRQYSNQIAKQ